MTRRSTRALLALFLATGLLWPSCVRASALTPSSVVDLGKQKGMLYYSGFSWIPKTHKLVYAKADASQSSWIYTIDSARGVSEKLLEGKAPVPSPDGRKIAFLRAGTQNGPVAYGNSGLQIWVADADGSHAVQVTHAGVCDFGNIAWSPDSRRLAYLTCSFSSTPPETKQADGATVFVAYPVAHASSSVYEVHVADLSTGRDLVALRHDGEFGTSVYWLDTNTVLYEHDNSKPLESIRNSLSTVDLASGRTRTVLSGYQWQAYYLPAVNRQRTALAFRADTHQTTWYPNRAEIGILNLQTHTVRLLPFTRNSVLGYMSWAPDGKWLLYSDGPSTRRELIATDGIHQHDVTSGDGLNKAPIFSSDGRYVAWSYDNGAGTTQLKVGDWVNASIQRARTLAITENSLRGFDAGKTSVVRWKSFDGTVIDGYLTVPAHKSSARYPTVVILHGGPIDTNSVDAFEMPGGIYFVAYLLQQGYAVFQPDYRESGSFGYDTVLQEYARGDVMSEDAQDILAGVDAVVKSHAVDPSRLYLLGHSYGSTLTDWIVSHDRRFRAAVSYEGFDFFYDWSRYSPYGTGAGIGVQHTVADTTPLTAPKLWAQNSAVLNAARVTTPTLFVVTENGMDCPSQAWLYGALRSKGVDSQFLLYHGEPHVIQKPVNQVDLINRILGWFKSH